jgi:hypothetical protein
MSAARAIYVKPGEPAPVSLSGSYSVVVSQFSNIVTAINDEGLLKNENTKIDRGESCL